MNDNGGINGRPIRYLVENDQWNPELASQVATKLIKDRGVVALVGNGSVVSMAVNARLYKKENIMVMASACAISDCYENSNIVSTNQGPLPSGIGALKYAIEELGTRHAACIGFNIPNNGGWACAWMSKYMESKGRKSTALLMDPTAVDLNSVYLQAVAEGVDTILLMLPAGPALGILKVAEEQDGRDAFKWGFADAALRSDRAGRARRLLGRQGLCEYRTGALRFRRTGQPELGRRDGQIRRERDRRDTFSQSGYVSAKFFVETLLAMDPAKIDRANVTRAIKAISGKKSDLLCGPYYVGDFDRHMPNHAGRMVVFKGGKFQVVRECYDIESSYLDAIRAQEKALGITK